MNKSEQQVLIYNQFQSIERIVSSVNSFVESSNKALVILEAELLRLKDVKAKDAYKQVFLEYKEAKNNIKEKMETLKRYIQKFEKSIKKMPLSSVKKRMLSELKIAKNSLKTLSL